MSDLANLEEIDPSLQSVSLILNKSFSDPDFMHEKEL